MSSIGSRLAGGSNPQFGAGYPQSQQYTPPHAQNNGYNGQQQQQPQQPQQQQGYASPQNMYSNNSYSPSAASYNNSGIIPPHQVAPNRG